MTTPTWLPPLVYLNDFKGNWDAYINAIYEYFKSDFINDTVLYKGMRIALKKHPQFQDKEFVFWHVTSEGDKEDERIPDFRRCERIRWIKPIIEHPDDPAIKLWENERKGDRRICLFFEQENYLVVLAIRNNYILLWTAYPVDRYHQQQKLLKEYEAYKRRVPPST